MKALSWVLLAVGCYGALACALMSGVLGATWAGPGVFDAWDYQGKLAWGRGVIAAAAAGWPWVLGFVACLGCAFAGAHLMMRDDAAGPGE
jgi:hypothetical protein